MSGPTEKHREIAKVIYDALGRGSTRDEEVIARALAKSEREGMKRGYLDGYLVGFKSSREGWNGEFPFADQNRSPEGSPEWVIGRDRALSEAVEGE